MSALPAELYRTQASIALLLFPAALALLAIPYVGRSYDRFGRLGTWPALVAGAGLLYACGLVAFTLFPLPDGRAGACLPGVAVTGVRWDPLTSLREIDRPVGLGAEASLRALVLSGPFLQVALNVVLFVPLGLLVRYREGRGLGVALLVGALASTAIEATQGTGDWGLYPCAYRQADTSDVLVNTVGAGLGWCAGALLRPVLPRALPEPVADLAPPRLARRAAAVVVDLVVVVLAGGVAVVALRAVRVLTPFDVPGVSTASVAETAVGTWLPALVLLVLLPILRADRATPGRRTLNLVPVRGEAIASRGRVALAQLVRFGPLFAALALGRVGLLLLVPAALGLLVAGRVSGTRTATRAGAGLRPPRGS